jgi:hypothetical protein
MKQFDLHKEYEDPYDLMNDFDHYCFVGKLPWKPEFEVMVENWSIGEFADQYVVEEDLKTIAQCISFFCRDQLT